MVSKKALGQKVGRHTGKFRYNRILSGLGEYKPSTIAAVEIRVEPKMGLGKCDVTRGSYNKHFSMSMRISTMVVFVTAVFIDYLLLHVFHASFL